MEDRELLELAAKAAGYEVVWCSWYGRFSGDASGFRFADSIGRPWNPLNDDGDALRLAATLSMRVYVYSNGGDDCTCVANDELNRNCNGAIEERHGGDKFAATRRAIVRAAAHVGKSMP